jgi:uncharacterized protein YndB with AHSA1/START domain
MEAATQIKEFVISRTVNAPRELVWKVWTDPKHLEKWFGPKGATSLHAKMDFRVGGTYHYAIVLDGVDIWGKWTFREITPPERLELIQSFSNPEGGIGRHPLAPTWPSQMLALTTFDDEGGNTIVTIHWAPYNSTDEEIETFNAGHESMTQGWGGTFDRLDDYLKTTSN